MEHHSTPTPKLSGWPPQRPRQPAKFLRCRLTERPWLRQFNEERSKVFRAGHDTSLPESEVPSPGRWIRSGRHAGCGIDHALRRLSRPILCESHQVAVSCADPVQKQVPGECGWSAEGSAPPGLGRVARVWGAWSQGVRFANPLDSPRPVTEEAAWRLPGLCGENLLRGDSASLDPFALKIRPSGLGQTTFRPVSGT